VDASGAGGKVSGRRVPVERCEEVEHLYLTRYQGLNTRHFHEHLVRGHGFAWSYSWMKAFRRAGICWRRWNVAARTGAPSVARHDAASGRIAPRMAGAGGRPLILW
jgi:hypothetical protein